MTVDAIRVVLGRLQDDPSSESAWEELAEIVTKPGAPGTDLLRLLEQARARFEKRREWMPVARLLEMELSLSEDEEPAMRGELARIFDEELLDSGRARAEYERLLELEPGEALMEKAAAYLENDDGQRAKWRELYDRYVQEAEGASDEGLKAGLYMTAADVALRYGGSDIDREAIGAMVEKAIDLEPKVRRGAIHAESALATEPTRLAKVLELILARGGAKDDRIASGLKAGRIRARILSDREGAIGSFEQVLDLSPGQPDALSFLAEAYTEAEQWDHLVALYEDQLKAGLRGEAEHGVLLQIAMVHWKMRKAPEAAEPHFDRLRRVEPTNGAMLNFFREMCGARGDSQKLTTVLSDAQRATQDAALKKELGTEIAALAEKGDNSQKAIEQYKSILKADPNDAPARESLKRLYGQAANHPALVDLLRQDLERLPADDTASRSAVLRERASVYRDRVKNEQQLVQVLQQLIQLDENDEAALRELVKIYEGLGRFRDLLSCQQRLAELTTDQDEKAELYRAVARRWGEQFSNVQNAIVAYEGLLAVKGSDEEARIKLRELYTKRRAWAQLFGLYELLAIDATGPQKIELLTEMAKLAAERLDRGADAIVLQKQILDLDPSASGVYDALEKQAEREKDYATLAEVLERRANASTDNATKLAVLQKLGGVYSDRLKDPASATKTWRRVLELAPGQAKAQRVLREAYVQSGDFDALEELYAAQNDWENLADFLSTAADKASDVAHKIELSFRAAAVFESKLNAPERAPRSYERVLAADGGNARAAAALVPIYEKEERWARLPPLYEVLLSVASDKAERVGVLRKLAQVTGGPLSDRNAALGYARRAYELVPDEENLAALENASRAASSWGPFVEAVEARLAAKDNPADLERMLRMKLANAYARELGKLDEAVVSYRALVEADPSDDATLREFDALLRGAERKEDLRWLFDLRIRSAAEGDRARIYEEWATLEEDVFSNPKEAIELYRKAAEIDPTRGETLRSLSRLLLAEGAHAAAAEVIARHREISEGADRAQREIELAFLFIDHLEQPGEALAAAERALELRPRDPDAIAILARLMDVEPTRARAATVLQVTYADLGDARREAHALRVMLETEADEATRLELQTNLADVEEKKLSSPSAAFDIVLSALTEFSSEISLWDRAAELSVKAGRPTDLSEAYRAHIITADPEGRRLTRDVELELSDRAATLHDEQLGDSDGALPYLKRILSMEPTSGKAFERLKQILTSAERWGELEELFDQAAQAAEDPTQKIALLNEVALIAEEVIGVPLKAIGYHERILEIDPFYVSSLDALEKLYEDEERFGELAALLERRLLTAIDEEAIDIRLYLGRLYLEQLLVPDRALSHIEDILRTRHEDGDARELAERMLEIGSLKLRTAVLLENVYEARDEVRSLVRMLEIRLEAAVDVDEKKALLRRVGELKDERLHDDAGSFRALGLLVPMVPDDEAVRERFVEIGKRLGKHDRVADVLAEAAEAAETKGVRAEVLMLVASLYETSLNDPPRAEEFYRKILAIDPDDVEIVVPAARALSRLQAEGGNHAALVQTLEVEVKLEESVDARKALYERLGDLYESMLENRPKAIEAWKARFSDDTSDEKALASLERLYEAEGRHRDLVDVLKKREVVSSDADERKRAMVKGAEMLAGPLMDVGEATLAWRAVLDAFGADRKAHAALASLYEKGDRHQDLAEVIEADLLLSDEPADRIGLYRRLGDVRRTQLSDLEGALEAYKLALEIEPSDPPTRAALEAMLELPDARKNAAELLHPLYEADGDAEKLLKVLDIESEVAESPGEKIDRLEKALATAEGPLGAPLRAYDYARRVFKEAVGDESIGRQKETLERLTATTERWADTMALYKATAADILDGDVQNETLLRIGELAQTRLDAPEEAIEYYNKVLEARPDERRALLALEALYEKQSDAKSLLEILKKREEAAESDTERKELIFRQAELLRGKLQNPADAIERLEAVLAIDVDERATSELERLYVAEGRHQDLVTLYERMLEAVAADPKQASLLRVKIAKTARLRLDDSARAFDELGEALSADGANADAIQELEQILGADSEAAGDDEKASASPEDRARAGEMLEPIYLRQGAWKSMRGALDARLTGSQDPTERIGLLKRLATLEEEQLENFGAAMDATARLLHEDVSDRSVWSELERLARASSAEKKLGDIYATELGKVDTDDETTAELAKRAGQIFADIDDSASALKWYRRAHAFEPESEELFSAIEKLLIKESRYDERVELMRAALDYREGSRKLELYHTIGDLEEHKLVRKDAAIETYRAALDTDTTDERSLDRLTVLYTELDRSKDLADLYERRIDAAESPEKGAPYRLALSRLLQTKLNDQSAAIDQLEAITSELPWHAEAIADLEAFTKNDAHNARVIEILGPLYERDENNWPRTIANNERRLPLTDDASAKAAILRENAGLYESRGNDKKSALESLRRAFDFDPEDSQTLAELERLARDLKAFEPFAQSLELALGHLDDDVSKRELLSALARVYDKDLDDPRRALATYERLVLVSPGDTEPLESVDELSVLLGDWKRVVDVLEKKVEGAPDAEASAHLRRLGLIQADMLDDSAAATKAYERALELEPDSSETIDRLIELHEAADSSARLVELYTRRVELSGEADGDLRYTLNMKAAHRQEGALKAPREAIVAYAAGLESRPGDQTALKSLERLYRSEEMFSELLDNLRDQAGQAADVSARAALRVAIGDLYKDKLDNAVDALEQYRLVLDEDAGNSGAIVALRSIAETNEDLRLDATDALLPVLRQAKRHEDLVAVLELRLLSLSDSEQRASTLREIAGVLDADLARPADAEAALLRALDEAPDDATLHTEVVRLATAQLSREGDGASEGFSRYAVVLADLASKALDAGVSRGLWTRLGEIAEERLKQDPRAAEAYGKALEHAAGEDSEKSILEALDRLHERTGNHKALAEVIERRVPFGNESEQADLHYRLGKLHIHVFDEPQAGHGSMRAAIAQNPSHPGAREELEKLTAKASLFEEVAETLESVYRAAGDNRALAGLFEKRIGFAESPSDRLRLRLDLARVLEDRASDPKAALGSLLVALDDDPADSDVLAEIERVAAVVDGWESAAVALEKATAARSDLPAETASDLWIRAAGWRKDKLADARAAERDYEEALKHDAQNEVILRAIEQIQRTSGRELDLVATLRRLAALDGAPAPAELRKEAKSIAQDQLSDLVLAEAILRDMIKADEADAWALSELTTLRRKAGDGKETFQLLVRRTELAQDASSISALRHEAAQAARDDLKDQVAAIDLYEQIFEEEPTDERASRALRDLYAESGKKKELLKLLGRLVGVADAKDRRAELRLEAAKVSDELEATSDAIDQLNAILEDDPAHKDAALMLSRLLEKTGRDDDLADLLNKQIELAQGRSDIDDELSYRVRLGEVQESRIGDLEKAAASFSAILERDAKHKDALTALARIQEKRGEKAEAAKYLERLLDLQADDEAIATAKHLAQLFESLSDDDGVQRALERGLALREREDEIRTKLRQLYEKKQNWAALSALLLGDARASEDVPDKVRILRVVAEINKSKLGDAQQAADLLREASELVPQDRELLLALCDAYSESGRGKQAVEALQKIVESYGGRRSKEVAGIHHRLARAYLADGERHKALAELDTAFKIDPGAIAVLRDLGVLSLELADADPDQKDAYVDRAGKTFKALLLQRLDDGAPITKAEVFYYLGEVSHRQGDDKKGIQMLERALDNDKNLEKAKELLAKLRK